MPFHIRNLSIEWVLLGVVWMSEFAGISQTLGVSLSWFGIPFTSVGFTFPVIIQLLFLVLWCLIQVYVTLLLAIQVYYAAIREDKAALTFLLNALLVGAVIQVYGFFHSPQMFGAAVALTDGIFLYIYRQNEQNRNMSRIVDQARALQPQND